MKTSLPEMRSVKDVGNLFRGMATVFDGKETEHNWKTRDSTLLDLSKIAEGNAPTEFHQAFVSGVKSLLDGIISCIISERTTLSNHACDCVRSLARSLGSSIHPMLDYLLPALIKLSAFTKPISSRAANETIREIIIGAKTYSPRLLHHLSSASTSENSAPRTYAPGWLETMIKLYGPQIDHSGGMRQVEDSLKRSLSDANVKTRENARPAYWAFAKQWPHRAEPIMASLEPQRQKALQDDPNNPNKISKVAEKYPRPGSSLAEAKAQAKKKLQAKQEASSPDDLPFVISLDTEKPLPNPPQAPAERRKAPIRPRHDAHHSVPPAQALQPISNPSSSANATARPDTGHGSIHSKSGSLDSTKSQESQSAQRSRPLMAAPVRRAVRVVSNSTPAQAARPNSREDQLPVREMKPPVKAVSIETPTSRLPSRSPVFEQPKKVEPRPKSRQRFETNSQAILEAPGPQKLPETVDKPLETPLEEHRRKPTQNKDVAPAQSAAKLQHAIKKIRNLDFAPIGFTRLRRLVETNSDALFNNKQPFDDVMTTMVYAMNNIDRLVAKHIQDQPENAYASIQQQGLNSRRPASEGDGLARDYRFAILSMIQSMLFINTIYFAPFYSQTMKVLLQSRAFTEDKDHKVKDLEGMAWSIIPRCDQLEMMRVVFDTIENLDMELEKPGTASYRQTLVMGLQVLTVLFSRAQASSIDETDLYLLLERGAQLASNCSRTTNLRIRKASVDFCVTLQKIAGEQTFDEIFRGDEGTKNMITYYAKKATTSNGEFMSIGRIIGWDVRE